MEDTFVGQNRILEENKPIDKTDDPSLTFVDQYKREEVDDDSYIPPKVTLFQKIIGNNTIRAFTIIVVIAVVLPLLIYYILNDLNEIPKPDGRTCLVEPSYRVLCGEVNVTRNKCLSIGGCYEPNNKTCFHSIPSAYGYFLNKNGTYSPSKSYSPLETKMMDQLRISVNEVNENKLQIYIHTDSLDMDTEVIPNKNYDYIKYDNPFGLDVFRVKNNKPIFTTRMGPLIISEGYWEFTFQLSTEVLFGLGELLLNSTEDITKVIYKNKNDHTSIAAFMAYQDGYYHGLYVEHEGPLEVTVLPSKLVVLKSLAEHKIVLHLHMGPTPKDVMLQQRAYKYNLPPRWILGNHICSHGKDLISVIYQQRLAALNEIDPKYETDCFDENLMMMFLPEQDNTTINLLADCINKTIKERNRKFIISLPPQIPIGDYPLYKLAEDLDVLYKDRNGKVWNGTYFHQSVAFTDFHSTNIAIWLKALFEHIQIIDPTAPDGLVLTSNWPAEETYQMSNDTSILPYMSELLQSSMSETIPWNLNNSQSNLHLIEHNNYGLSQIAAIERIVSKDIIIMTSSYQYGLQNPAIIQNKKTSWINLKRAIVTNLNHGIFAHPLVSTPVCGSDYFPDVDQEKICLRWYLMAATMPVLRVSSEWPNKYLFGRNVAMRALQNRKMLSYYYYNYLKNEEPITRPMFYNFHQDNNTFSLDEQYMVGNSLLVAQPVVPDIFFLRVYLPKVETGWYEFWGGRLYKNNGWMFVDIVESDWIMYLQAGSIVPLLLESDDGENVFELAVAFSCSENNCTAKGIIEYDSVTLELSATKSSIILDNISDVQDDLCKENHPTSLKKLRIYHDTYEERVINVNLCNVTNNVISYRT